MGFWNYRAANALGVTNKFLIKTELSKSFLPIAYFTGITCIFWSYIVAYIALLSKAFDGLSHISMSPIWLCEYLINKVADPFYKKSPLKTEIPLNITRKVACGSDLTWKELSHTFEFIKNMTQKWEKHAN